MSAVKGSDQTQLVIRQYHPQERALQIILTVVMLIVLGVGGFYAGQYHSRERVQHLTSERDSLQTSLDDAERTITTLTQRVSVLEKGGEVDRKATDGVRQTVKELKTQVANLEEEVSFYKGIMAPSGNDKGLRVGKIDIQPQDNERKYNYSIMLTQVADNSTFIEGLAAVNFVGLKKGEKVILPLRDLAADITDLGVKFRFRYFQEFKGEIELPPQFVPEQVQVVLQSTGGKAQRVEQSIEWPQ